MVFFYYCVSVDQARILEEDSSLISVQGCGNSVTALHFCEVLLFGWAGSTCWLCCAVPDYGSGFHEEIDLSVKVDLLSYLHDDDFSSWLEVEVKVMDFEGVSYQYSI